jgi:hypothetical protein
MDEYESRQERTLPHAPRTESYERHSRIKYGAPHLMRWTERLSCPFSIGLHKNSRPDSLFPVDMADAGMRGGGRALSDG